MNQDIAQRRPADLVHRHWRLLFVAMLALMHITAMRGVEDFWARAFMLAHFGLFILWQPFMRSERSLTALQSAAIACACILALFYWNWWLMLLWVGVLVGVVGGRVFLFQARSQRIFHLTVLVYLVALLLIWVFPKLLPDFRQTLVLEQFTEFGLPLLFLLMLAMPVKADAVETPQVVDFFYSAFLFMIIALLVLGSFAFMTVGKVSYPFALTYSLLLIAGILLLLGLAWNPRAGFSGLGMLFSRYLLSVGLPFEQWVHFLAELSRAEGQPERFLREACAGLSKLPWVSGGSWRSLAYSGEFGQSGKNFVDYSDRELKLRVFTHYSLSPALSWHFQLLGQLLSEYYLAKLREQKLQRQSYMQAVYETGARMTHDVKNLLQSLNVLCTAAEQSDARAAEFQALMRRQLPVIAQRLQQTLDKLRQPRSESSNAIAATDWWAGLQRSYAGQAIEFIAESVDAGVMLPREVMDSAADNLIQNALGKRKLQGGVAITVSLSAGASVRLEVRDTGAAVDAEIAGELLRGPVASESGLGIGLYQAARLADSQGYALRLLRNSDGEVCFALEGPARLPEAADSGQDGRGDHAVE